MTINIIKIKEKEDFDRDIFITDSESLNALNDETSWLKQALLVYTISFFVSTSSNINEPDLFMKYLRLETVVGGKKTEHVLGYIAGMQTFNGENIIEQLHEQNKNNTNEMINGFNKSSFLADDEHFRYISILMFYKHLNEYFSSITEVAKFIIDRCLNEGTLSTGDFIADTHEEFAMKINDTSDLNDTNKMFETIF